MHLLFGSLSIDSDESESFVIRNENAMMQFDRVWENKIFCFANKVESAILFVQGEEGEEKENK